MEKFKAVVRETHVFFGWLNLKLPKETFHGPKAYGREPTSLALNFRPSIAWLKISTLPIARTWKQPKCPSTEEWIKKMWYIYAMEYYSAIKRNEIGSFVETWMDLESLIQSEVSQQEKNKFILMHICGI